MPKFQTDRAKLDHLPLYDVPFMLGASKRTSWKARVLMQAQATAEVLSDQGLTKHSLIERFDASPESFKVLIGELTDPGVAFARKHYQRWLANSDRWEGEVTLSKFKKALEAQCVKFRASIENQTD